MQLKNIRIGRWISCRSGDRVLLGVQVRLHRNLGDRFFPPKMTGQEKKDLLDLFRQYVQADDLLKKGKVCPLNELTENEINFLEEENFLLPGKHAEEGRGLFILPSRSLGIVVNDLNHLTILSNASTLLQAWGLADKVDNGLSHQFRIAFNQKMGFLTTTPDYLGNGLRFSALVHLPALKRKGGLQTLIGQLKQEDFEVQEYGSPAQNVYNDLLEISHAGKKYSLLPEKQALLAFGSMLTKIRILEEKACSDYLEQNRKNLQDEVARAFGVLRYAVRVSLKEAVHYLSGLIFGIRAGFLDMDAGRLFKLLILIRKGHLRVFFDKINTEDDEMECRAELIRKELTDAMEDGDNGSLLFLKS